MKELGQIAAPLPLYKLCQTALHWQAEGLKEKAGQLAHWLLPLAPFPSLWCPEKEYNENELKRWFSLLSEIERIPGGEPANADIRVMQSSSIAAAFTLSGHATSLGAIRANEVEIRALGPQAASLHFGIQGRGMDGWAQCFAMPEVWLEIKPVCTEMECKLDLRFVGLRPEAPLFFALYVKAPSCQVGNAVLRPRSLRRFHGEEKRVKLGSAVLESTWVHKMEVIPLAGEGCFWGCEFLISFEICPLAPQISFSIRV